MKKQIAIAMGLAVISTSAFATKARLEALGEDAGGSQFISDNRNVFLNPATVNYHKDFVTFEWGDTDTGVAATSPDTDAAATPHAEGGFFKASGNMAYGVYFGSESNTSNRLRGAAGVVDSGGNFVDEENNIDLFVAGDAGIQWGANLTYTSSKNEQDATEPEQQAMRATVGAITGDIEAFADVGLANTAESSVAEFEGESSLDAGASYAMGDVTYMARFQIIQAQDGNSDEFKAQNIWVGAAKNYRLNDKSNVWVSGWYKTDNSECEGAFATNGACDGTAEEKKDSYVPINVAVEVAVKEWLTLRGSVGQNLIGTTDNGDDKATISDSTTVAAGASLNWGDFQVDGLIGNMNTNATGNNTVGSTDTENGGGVLRTDALMSRVSFLYKF